MKGEAKKLKREQRQLELLKHFEGDHYDEKRVGDEWYIKMWNGGTKKWQVAVYSIGSYNNYKSYERQKDEVDTMDEEIQDKIHFERPTLESVMKMVENK